MTIKPDTAEDCRHLLAVVRLRLYHEPTRGRRCECEMCGAIRNLLDGFTAVLKKHADDEEYQ